MSFKHKIVTLFVLFLGFYPAVGFSAPVNTGDYFKSAEPLSNLSLYKQNDITLMSYRLNVKREALLLYVQNKLNSGEGVQVSHILNIATEELDFDADFDVQFLRYAKKDSVTGDILCGETRNRMRAVATPSDLSSCLFDAKRIPIAPRGEHLSTGVNYDVEASVTIMPLARKQSFWNIFNPIVYFDESVDVRMTYIGR